MKKSALSQAFITLAGLGSMLWGLGLTATGTAAAAPATDIWTPCTSADPMPAYAALVKGMHGTCVHTTAQVFQFDTVTGNTHMLIYITNEGAGLWDNLVWVTLASASLGKSIYQNNIVYLVGRLDGTYTYTTNLLGTNTVPAVDVTQIHLAANSTPKTTTPTTVKPKTVTPTTIAKPSGPAHVVGAFPGFGGNGAGGYVLYSNGLPEALDGAPFYGDARKTGLNNFVTMAQNGDGYWLVTASGQVFTYGGINGDCQGASISRPKTLVGQVIGTLFLSRKQQNNSDISAGFQMVTSAGDIYTYACVISF